jgi:uncharacterized protein involved in type VI secretion and phage assembly
MPRYQVLMLHALSGSSVTVSFSQGLRSSRQMTLNQTTRHLGLSTALGEELCLTSFQGEEVFSQLFRFELQMISENVAIEPKSLIGTRATFSVKKGDASPRYFDGFINRFRAGDEDFRDSGRYRNYTADVVPWLWFVVSPFGTEGSRHTLTRWPKPVRPVR